MPGQPGLTPVGEAARGYPLRIFYRVVQPPSMRMVWPVTYWLASLAS
jgi:hypothetical protein